MSSSYFIKKSYNGEPYRGIDQACFANLNSSLCEESYVIVEKAKIDNEEKFLKYLSILKTFTFMGKVVKVEEGYHIYLDTKKIWDSALTTMLIRYAWEGRYTQIRDEFYKIYDLFMELIEQIPQEDYLPLFLFCNNYILFPLAGEYNSNHCLALGGYSEHTVKLPKSMTTEQLLKKKGTTNGVSRDGFFEMMEYNSFKYVKCKTTEQFEKLFEDYKKL